jgi:hypothetical protein
MMNKNVRSHLEVPETDRQNTNTCRQRAIMRADKQVRNKE